MATKQEVLQDLEDACRSFLDAEPEERDDLADTVRVLGNRFYAARRKGGAAVDPSAAAADEQPKPPTVKHLRSQAKELGIPRTSRMGRAELETAIAQAQASQ